MITASDVVILAAETMEEVYRGECRLPYSVHVPRGIGIQMLRVSPS